ncbi:hypothetical protein CALCODRAFT_51589 [Calocera cornea HHB12733]|uniref:Amidoligase enzyme n=1 Tax=Calocera cornea HHB12733 TaxID=1353952 RepID=A0A165DSI8_9BASI|nr:hypothetical protein CALCODRAFT_51589 [Calocera cornea HHB12733]
MARVTRPFALPAWTLIQIERIPMLLGHYKLPVPRHETVEMARKLSIGFEIECLAVLDTSAPGAIQRIIDLINNTAVHRARGFSSTYPPDETRWHVVRDRSIRSNDVSLHGVELIAPPVEDLPGTELLSPSTQMGWKMALQEVLHEVKSHLTLKVNVTTGLHVHVGPGINCKWDTQHLIKIALLFVFFEDQLDQWHPRHRWDQRRHHTRNYLASMRESRTCANLRDLDLVMRILAATDWQDLASLVNPCPYGMDVFDKNYKVNFGAVRLYGTVEFRQHAGTTCAREIVQWGEDLLALVRWAVRVDRWELVDMCLRHDQIQLRDLLVLAVRSESSPDATPPLYLSPTV